ncbi:gastric triacylglycerol lipase-like isoform X2 [Zophobas morio]|uniref:gastric triacylglycerol lipase-like isoform X2 n=1 Tax=Zophobas morio TaxID=2755281 RepID=UPI003082F401
MYLINHVVATTVTLILVDLTTLSECRPNNICRNFIDYSSIQTNPNCWYNPDLGATAEQIATRYGFPFEEHEVTTGDGYIITLFRIPHNGSDVHRKRPVVFLQHGIAADGYTWMVAGRNSSGYDVWISNCRGTEPSSKHVKYTPYDREFWLYSFHEMALYDIPAMLDFVAAKTQQQISYVGHSMGCTMALIYTSLMPQQAQTNLKSIVALAPVAFMDHVTSAVKLIVPFRYIIWEVLSSAGIYGVGPQLKNLQRLSHLCGSYPFIKVCVLTNALLSGINTMEASASAFPIGIRHFPIGLSMKTIFHYAQIMDTRRRFQFFDYGPELNWRLYNSSLPPEYPIGNVRIPMHLFYGNRDTLSAEKDVHYLYEQLRTNKTIKEVFNFAHLDFLGATHSADLYYMLLDYL